MLGSSAGVVAAGATATWWTAGRPRRAPAQGGGTRLPEQVVALHADLTGDQKTAGLAQQNGVRLAVDRFNSRADRAFDLALQAHDDAGSITRAQQIALQLSADDRVRAVIGPTTDACAKAVLEQYRKALLPMVCVSVGLDGVSAARYRTYAATRPPDRNLAAPLVAHLVRTVRTRRTVLIDDAAQGDFSWQLCADVEQALRSGQRTTTRHTLAAEDDTADDFRALAETVTDWKADAVLFAGGFERAAKLARALRAAGYSGARLATQRALDTRFFTVAADAAEGWVFATAFLDPTRVTAAKSFVADYRHRFGTAPPWYSAEAYDATLFVARALTTLRASLTERGPLVARLRETDYQGITKRLRYTSSSTGYTTKALYLFQASGGHFRFLGQFEDATT
ncbi:ABC transporter substrate-binding protein [Streptomyces chartreusis]